KLQVDRLLPEEMNGGERGGGHARAVGIDEKRSAVRRVRRDSDVKGLRVRVEQGVLDGYRYVGLAGGSFCRLQLEGGVLDVRRDDLGTVDVDRGRWRAVAGGSRFLNGFANGVPLRQDAEDRMLEVEEAGWRAGYKHLRVVRVVGRFGHRQQAGRGELQVGVE